MENESDQAKLTIPQKVHSLPSVNSKTITAIEDDKNLASPIARQSLVTPTLETDMVGTEHDSLGIGSADRHGADITYCTPETEETSDDSTTIEGQETGSLNEEAPQNGDHSTLAGPMTKVEGDDNNSEEGDKERLPRRSRRDINRIRLQGTAPTFFRRLQVLFSPSVGDGYKALNSKRLQLTKECSDPPIYVVDNFLTENELTYFHDKIKTIRFEKSFVDNMDYDNDGEYGENKEKASVGNKRQRRTLIDSSHRTSTFFSFGKRQDSRIAALESRVADLLGCWVGQIEALQLVRYIPGQFFGVHHDMGDLLEDDQVALPPRDVHVKRRLVTLFVYLNSLEEDQGGCTHFPFCNLRVHPKKGRALLWSNVTTDGLPDPRTIHAGEPVKPSSASSGRRVTRSTKPPAKNDTVVKYGLNIWICEE